MKTVLKRIDGTVIAESDTLTLIELVIKNKANLCEANLYGANLRWADLPGANLCRANLCEANLYGANLYGANLYGADLRRADLSGADLRGANLYGADLRRADLSGADLRGADLSGANLDFASWPLWCGSKKVEVCKKIAAQIAMHFCWLDCDDVEVKSAQEAVKKLAMRCKHWEESENNQLEAV